jgi:hypothetical protein
MHLPDPLPFRVAGEDRTKQAETHLSLWVSGEKGARGGIMGGVRV